MLSQKPKVFIGSSSEGKKIAKAIRCELQPDCEVHLWTDDIFTLSKSALESLVAAVNAFDFAVLVLTGDDTIQSRGSEQRAPRDNVLFELGLFTGAIGRDRTFMVCEYTTALKIPTDLAGITAATYRSASKGKKNKRKKNKGKTYCLEEAGRTIRENIKNTGLRVGREHLGRIMKDLLALQELKRPYPTWFCEKRLWIASRGIRSTRHLVEKSDGGKVQYSGEVRELLLDGDYHTVLALCGGKFDNRAENDEYFGQFYHYAERRKNSPRTFTDNIYVCRVFIQPESGEFDELISKVIRDHRAHREEGVLALTIESERRRRLEDHFSAEFCTALDGGIGFLLLLQDDGAFTVVHEGIANNLAFFTFSSSDEPELTRDMKLMFKVLCEESLEYVALGSGGEKERATLDSLLRRIAASGP